MQKRKTTGAQIRQQYIDFFVERGHTYVPSTSLVPGGDQTLLFTNAGMVQFKDVFLGTEKRLYTRAANSQKCMRVSGKHNDLDDVGRDDTHHTFFEMLGNWSFGDYYKKEAIAWAWELLTNVWRLPEEQLWATCFRDDQGNIPQDDEASDVWRSQPGIDPSHVLFYGRKDNFWEMADTGPCGPCSEIHIDRGVEFCNKKGIRDHICGVNKDCQRFLELWNLVFIQYNRLSPTHLEPLSAKHVDTGMGFERIVSVLQKVDSNYKTDLFLPMMDKVQVLTGHSNEDRMENITPYRVIADHARAATFLIADGVVPGNTSRNYVCRMVIRRAARFGTKIGLKEPFISKVAEVVIENYGSFYPELKRNRSAILDALTREEIRFQKTLESGMTKLDDMFEKMLNNGKRVLPGDLAFDLYATYGLPLEITRDIARENNLDVDEAGFRLAMEDHRLVSGVGEAFSELGAGDMDVYRVLFEDLKRQRKIQAEGVLYDPYSYLQVEGQILAIINYGKQVNQVQKGDQVEILLPKTCFYVESGGQVSDMGLVESEDTIDGSDWAITIHDMRKPIAGVIIHIGEVIYGNPKTGDRVIARVDAERRKDIMRNHTATHLLHRELRRELGDHARQAGSLVAPDHLRFDFTHPEALTIEQLERVEAGVNNLILQNHHLNITYKPLQQAIAEGAIALFGEKYDETVRNITIGEQEQLSNELCGGTHLQETGDVGLFLITSEGSVAAGIRRIEAVTGRVAYQLIRQRLGLLKKIANMLSLTPEQSADKIQKLLSELNANRKLISTLRQLLVEGEFNKMLEKIPSVSGIHLLTARFEDANSDTLRQLADRFRQRYKTDGVAVIAGVTENRPTLVATVTQDLVSRGVSAIKLVKFVASPLGGGGGGKPTLAQAGGKDARKLDETLSSVKDWIKENIK